MLLENPNAGGVYAEAVLEEADHMDLDSLKVLEGRVEDILSRQAALSAERDRLQVALEEAQRRVGELQRQVDTYERERTQVRARVESILGRLEGLDLS
jgi:chromosome segregation ATPase